MTDRLVRAVFDDLDIKASVATVTHTARTAQIAHQLEPVSAMMLGQWLCAGALMAALQKGNSRINLQLECDGPLRGMFVDAAATGEIRGYAKNRYLSLQLDEGPFRYRPALGNSGFISVLRNIGDEEYYRSSVQLEAFSLATDLNHYFMRSDQVPTAVAMHLAPTPTDALGLVVGVLLQLLPSGNTNTFHAVALGLEERLAQAAVFHADAPTEILKHLIPNQPFTEHGETPLQWACTCSQERVFNMLRSLGKQEMQEILETLGEAKVTCQFCGTTHIATRQDLQLLLETPA
jgi:molecular chaperone Hsp33